MLLSNTFISLILGTVAYQCAADDLRDAGKIAPAVTQSLRWYVAQTAGTTPQTINQAPTLGDSALELELSSKYGITGTELQILASELRSKLLTKETINRYQIGADAAQYAAISEAIYGNASLVDFDKDGKADWKLDPKLNRKGVFTGFHGAVYVHTSKEEVVIAFEGTTPPDAANLTTLSQTLIDLLNDVAGAAFSDPQTVRAEPLVKEALAKYGKDGKNYRIVVTGHSLGGRLAQIVAASQGLEAFTFNPAAVSKVTQKVVVPIDPSKITNILMVSDVVNPFSKGSPTGQSRLGSDLGQRVEFYFPWSGILHEHSITTVAQRLSGVKRVYEDKIKPILLSQQKPLTAAANPTIVTKTTPIAANGSTQSAEPLSGARLSIFGLGPIRIGMSVAEVERASGLAFRGAAEQSGQSCYYVEHPSPSGLIFLLVKNWRVAGVSVLSDAHTTMSGVRNGDSKYRVMATYGARLTELTGVGLIYTPKDPSESQYRMVFTLADYKYQEKYKDKYFVTSINAVKLPDGESLLKGDIFDGCKNHVGAARQLSLTTSVQLRDEGMVVGRVVGESVLLSPNLKYVVSTLFDEKRPNDTSVRGRIRAWDATTGARIADWQAHKVTIQSLALSPRGDLLASSASDRSVTVWRLPEGRQIATWVDPTESIQSLSFDGSGTILVGYGSEVVRIWNAATGSLQSSITKSVEATVVSPDGSLIAIPAAAFEEGHGSVGCKAFSPDGRYFAWCQGDSIHLSDVSSWRIVWKFQRASRNLPFKALAFHPNGQHLAVTSPYGSIWLLDLRTGEPVAFVPRSQNNTSFAALGFAASDNALVAFNFNGFQLDRWPLGNAISSASASSGVLIGGLPLSSSTAGTTPTSIGGAAVPETGVAAAPGRSAMSGRTLEPIIVAAALGKTATNGGTLDLLVPKNVGIEVTFSFTQPSSANYTFSWVIDGKPTGDGARIVRWLPPGQHKVELQAWDAGSYANSTPAMITAAKVPSRTVQVSVNVNDPGWDCLGRLGAGCNDKPTTNFAATAAVTVSIACRGKPDQVCVSSSMSVGSIKHDRCCQERQEQGKPPGFWCDDRSDKEDPTVCTAEWAQAQFDSKVAELPIFDLVRPSFANARFKHLWVYPPDGSDKPSLGKEGWWQRLAGHGVIMSYSDSQPDKLEQSVCRVGTASRQSIGEMKNSNLAVGPIFSKTHAWICD